MWSATSRATRYAKPPGPIGAGGWALTYGVSKAGFDRIVFGNSRRARVANYGGVRGLQPAARAVATERVMAAGDKLEFVRRHAAPVEIVGDTIADILTAAPGDFGNGGNLQVQEIARRDGHVARLDMDHTEQYDAVDWLRGAGGISGPLIEIDIIATGRSTSPYVIGNGASRVWCADATVALDRADGDAREFRRDGPRRHAGPPPSPIALLRRSRRAGCVLLRDVVHRRIPADRAATEQWATSASRGPCRSPRSMRWRRCTRSIGERRARRSRSCRRLSCAATNAWLSQYYAYPRKCSTASTTGCVLDVTHRRMDRDDHPRQRHRQQPARHTCASAGCCHARRLGDGHHR